MPSRPPDIKARNTSIDPLQLLPPELFVFVFSFLYQVDIAISAASSKTWRRILLSSPHLFKSLDLTLSQSQSHHSINDISRHRIINRQIGALIRASQLSNNRIKHVRVDLSQFLHDAAGDLIPHWNTTRLATFFNLLYLSKDSLRFLTLDLPEYDEEAIYAYSISIEEVAEHMRSILLNLKDFSMLDEIKIAASSFLEIRYEWKGKSLEIYRNKTDFEAITSSKEVNLLILDAVQSYSRGSFTSFDWEGRIDRATVRKLWDSRNSLESIRLRLVVLKEDSKTELTNLIMNCSNLKHLEILFGHECDEYWMFHNLGSLSFSPNLVKVRLFGVFEIPWSKHFFERLGDRVEELNIVFIRWAQETLPGTLLDMFLRPLTSTLKTVSLVNIRSFQPTSSLTEQENRETSFEPLSLATLQELRVWGDVRLINYFLAIRFSNLALVNLKAVIYEDEEPEEEVEINYQDLRRAVTSCSGTLSDLKVCDPISERRWTDSQIRKKLSRSQFSSDLIISNSHISIEFQSLHSLTLETKSPIVFEFSLDRYPRLRSLDLGPDDPNQSLRTSFFFYRIMEESKRRREKRPDCRVSEEE